MEALVVETVRLERPAGQALQLAREIERVLRQMQADLDAAEAKFARANNHTDYRHQLKP